MNLFETCADPQKILKDIISCISHVVIITDSDGIILFSNPAIEKVFGYAPGELTGRSMSLLFTKEDLPYLYTNLLALCQNNRIFEGEVMLVRKGGDTFFTYMEIKPCIEPNNDQSIIVISIVDIDKRKRLEKDPKGTHFEDLVKVADGIAHELRNPLTGIGGFVNRLYNTCKSDNHNVEYFESIKSNIEKIETLIKKVELFVRLPEPVYSEVSLVDIVKKGVEPHTQEMEQLRITIAKDIENVKVQADISLLSKAVSNLIENSLYAVSGESEIAISGKVVGNECVIHIEDRGEGISPKNLPHIFTPFFTTKPHSSGLGLSIVKRIMERHGGSIKTLSEEGKGATFILTFPLERRRSIRVSLISEDGAKQQR